MKLNSFRITNFRSIVDTGWHRFSPDNVTVFVGQNESGKTSILEALSVTFGQKDISEDDIRSNCPLPTIGFRIQLNPGDLDPYLTQFHSARIDAVNRAIEKQMGQVNFMFYWEEDPANKRRFEGVYKIDDAGFSGALDESQASANSLVALGRLVADAVKKPEKVTATNEEISSPPEPLSQALGNVVTLEDVAQAIYALAPDFVLFNSRSGLLPNTIDITTDNQLSGDGSVAADNFLAIAGLSRTHFINTFAAKS